MYINKTDIRTFRAKQLTVEFQPPETTVDVDMYEGALIPSENDTDVPMSSISIQILFKGETRNEIRRHVSNFIAMLQQGVDIKLDGYEDKFKGYLKSSSVSKTITSKKYTADFEFSGYWYSESVEVDFNGEKEVSFFTRGNRKTPCVLIINAKEYIDTLTITGFSDQIKISKIASGDVIEIDGENGIVTDNGENKFKDVELWDFPWLDVNENKDQCIKISSDKVDAKIRYRPMWI